MRLIQFLSDSVNDKAILKCVMAAGSPGAGKSHVLKKIGFSDIAPRVVNTDRWTEWFGKGANVDWDEFGKDVNRLTLQDLYLYINSMLPLFIDTTAANFEVTNKRKNILEDIGYDVGCIFIETSLETALERNGKRKRKVPEEYLIDTFAKVREVKSKCKSAFGYFKEIKNDVGELTDAVILKAFKEVQGFFNTPVQNEKGKAVIEQLRRTGGKYLMDLSEFSNLKSKLAAAWF